MSGPAGELSWLNALLNPAGKLVGPADGHVGRAAEEVNHQPPFFFSFFSEL